MRRIFYCTIFSFLLLLFCSFTKKQICVIVNPISGEKCKETLAEEIRARLDKERYEVSLFFTQAPHHATALAQEALKRGADIIAVVGGDGTVNEVSQVLIGSTVPLAIIPSGSGNGLARHLHIPMKSSEAINLLETGVIQIIDAVQINERFFFGVAGIGFDAEVGWSFAQEKKRGFFTYFLTAVKKFPGYQTCDYDLFLDGEKMTRHAFLISFANSSQFGNGAIISPKARIDDGFLDVVILKKFPLYAALPIAYRLFNSSLHRSDYVEIIRCKKITILQNNLRAHIDGEPIFFQEGIQMQVLPSSLKVLVPQLGACNTWSLD